MGKVVNLTVHKNNVNSRRLKEIRKTAKQSVNELLRRGDVEAYCFVTWNKDETYNIRMHDPKAVVGLNRMSSFVEGAIRREVAEIDNT